MQKEFIEQQSLNDDLKAQLKHLKDNEAAARRQVKLWSDLKVLMDAKKRCLEKQLVARAEQKDAINKQDHLVL